MAFVSWFAEGETAGDLSLLIAWYTSRNNASRGAGNMWLSSNKLCTVGSEVYGGRSFFPDSEAGYDPAVVF